MKVVIAIDSFKGSLTSTEAAHEIAEGVREVFPDADIVALPIADGGEGLVEALVHATDGVYKSLTVQGPLAEQRIEAVYGILGDGKTAAIEVAAACGLPLVPLHARNPFLTTTYGVGELIKDAINQGIRKFIVGLGGSATNDAGVGMLQALGFQFTNKAGDVIGFGGQYLREIAVIEAANSCPELIECEFRIACDVRNPLYGQDGAAFVFAPQKGADDKMVRALDEGLMHFAEQLSRQLGKDIHDVPGAGAAGGLGGAFAGLLNGQLLPGTQLVLSAIGMEAKLKDAELVITGEGRLDGQTSMGKVPLGVAQLAQKHGIPVIALAGNVEREAEALHKHGITSCFSIISGPMELEYAMQPEVTKYNLRNTARQILRTWQAAATRTR